MYLSSKILEFKMRCHDCSNLILVQTDPENCEYVYKIGAKRVVRNLSYSAYNNLPPSPNQLNTETAKTDVRFMRDHSEKEKIAVDPFYSLENTAIDEEIALKMNPGITGMIEL